VEIAVAKPEIKEQIMVTKSTNTEKEKKGRIKVASLESNKPTETAKDLTASAAKEVKGGSQAALLGGVRTLEPVSRRRRVISPQDPV